MCARPCNITSQKTIAFGIYLHSQSEVESKTSPCPRLLCLFHNQIEEEEMGRACGMNGEKRNAYRLFVGKPEGKRPLGDQHIGG
jgi:hypothetical protein